MNLNIKLENMNGKGGMWEGAPLLIVQPFTIFKNNMKLGEGKLGGIY
jgi:hypothetical protein